MVKNSRKIILKIVLGFLIIFNFLTFSNVYGNNRELSITKGIQWLKLNQNPSGYWGSGEYGTTTFRDTCIVADVLKLVEELQTYNTAIGWINIQEVRSVRQIARKSASLIKANIDVSDLINKLISYQNRDGGWSEYDFIDGTSNIEDTIYVYRAILSTNYGDASFRDRIAKYILVNQNTDGGFGVGGRTATHEGLRESNVYGTALVVQTFKEFNITGYDTQINGAIGWLLSRQNTDGSWGENEDKVWMTSLATMALITTGGSGTVPFFFEKLGLSLTYLLSTQAGDGSWNSNPYDTALAVKALKYASPELSISSADITFSNEKPQPNEVITLSATIHNNGYDVANNVVVRFFEDMETVPDVQIGQDVAIPNIPAGSSATAQVPWTASLGTHKLYIVIDPNNTIWERVETNNTASKDIEIRQVTAPERLTATAGNQQITLSWQAHTNPDVVGYNIYRNYEKINTELVSTTSFTNTGLINYTLYSYYITAVDNKGFESYPSNIIKIMPSGIPIAPAGLKITPGNTEVYLSWSENPEPNIIGYNIYRNGTKITPIPIPEKVYIDRNLTNGIDYTYQISAVNYLTWEGSKSFSVIVKPTDLAQPVILEPTTSDKPIETSVSRTDVSGICSPNTSVILSVNDEVKSSVGSVQSPVKTVLASDKENKFVNLETDRMSVPNRVYLPNTYTVLEDNFSDNVIDNSKYQKIVGWIDADVVNYMNLQEIDKEIKITSRIGESDMFVHFEKGIQTTVFNVRPVEVTVDFKVPVWIDERNWDTAYLYIQDKSGHIFVVQYYGGGYRYDPNVLGTRLISHTPRSKFGNEDSVYHTMKIVYNPSTQRAEGFIDNISLGVAELSLEGWMFAGISVGTFPVGVRDYIAPRSHEVRFDNFKVIDTSAVTSGQIETSWINTRDAISYDELVAQQSLNGGQITHSFNTNDYYEYVPDVHTRILNHLNGFEIPVPNVVVGLGNITYEEGALNLAGVFNGNSIISYEDFDSQLGASTEGTLECWINPDSDLTGEALLFRKYRLDAAVVLKLNANRTVAFGTYTDTGAFFPDFIFITTPQRIPDGEWTHIAGVWGREGKKLYINGSLAVSDPRYSFPWVKSTLPLYIGEGFKGKLDEIRVSDTQRTVFNLTRSNYRPVSELSLADLSKGRVKFRSILTRDSGSTISPDLTKLDFRYTMWSGGSSFKFPDVSLEPGENNITVIQKDAREHTSPASLPISVTYKTTAPAVVKSFTGVAGNGYIELRWNPNKETDLAGYNIYRDGFADPINSKLIIGTTFTDKNLTNGVTYGYTIHAVNTAGIKSEPASVNVKLSKGLFVESMDIFLEPFIPSVGSTSTLKATINNFDIRDANDVAVQFYEINPANYNKELLGSTNIQVSGTKSAIASISWQPDRPGLHLIWVTIKCLEPADMEIINGNAWKMFQIGEPIGVKFIENHYPAYSVSSSNPTGPFLWDEPQPPPSGYGVGWYKGLADFLSEQGYQVSTLDRGNVLTNESVQNIQTLVILATGVVTENFSNSEINVIENFVKSGGSLFLIGNWSDYSKILNPIANRFNASFDRLSAEKSGTSIRTRQIFHLYRPDEVHKHPATAGADDVRTNLTNIIERWPEEAVSLITMPYYSSHFGRSTSLAIPEEGIAQKGRLILTADTNFFDTQPDIMSLNVADNKKLASANFNWLAHIKYIDLSISKEDISFNNLGQSPENGTVPIISGDVVNISATVRNIGDTNVGSVAVQFFNGNPEAEGVQIGNDLIIDKIYYGRSEVVSVNFDTTGIIGAKQIYVRVKLLDDSLKEYTLANNIASKELIVYGTQFATEVNTDKLEYTIDEELKIDINITNTGNVPRDTLVEVSIKDEEGNVVKQIGSFESLNFAPLEVRTFNFVWNTEKTISGKYKVVCSVNNLAQSPEQGTVPIILLSEGVGVFNILPDLKISNTVVVDKVQYFANEKVTITGRVKSESQNYAYKNLTAKISIEKNGIKYFGDRKKIELLPVLSTIEQVFYWDTGTLSTGNYTVNYVIYDEEVKIIASSSSNIKIVSSPQLSGNITIEPHILREGVSEFNLSFSVNNTGNTNLTNIPIKIEIIDVVNKVKIITDSISLSVSGSTNKTYTLNRFEFPGYPYKYYNVLLSANIEGKEIALDNEKFVVIDKSSLPVEITYPVSNTEIRARSLSIAGTASDPLMTSYKLEYSFGKLPYIWQEIINSTRQIEDSILGVWDVSKLAEGDYTIRLTVNYVGESAKSVSVPFYLSIPSLKPANLTATADSQNIYLTWDKVSDGFYPLAGYYIYRKKTTETNYVKIGQTNKETINFVDNSAEKGVQYNYVVSSYDNERYQKFDSKEDWNSPMATLSYWIDTEANPGNLQLKKDVHWNVTYEANKLPQNSEPIWQRDAFNYKVEEINSEGQLHISINNGGRLHYYRSWGASNSNGWIVEAKLKKVLEFPSYRPDLPDCWIMIDDGSATLALFIKTNRIISWSSGFPQYFHNFSDEFHTIRIIGKGLDFLVYLKGDSHAEWQLIVDGKGKLVDRGGANTIGFGAYNGEGESIWDYVRYSTISSNTQEAYYEPGEWIYESINASSNVKNWGVLNAGVNLNSQRTNFAVSSSPDEINWSNWENVLNGSSPVSTPVQKYLRLKANLSTNNINVTPVLENLTFNWKVTDNESEYSREIVAPIVWDGTPAPIPPDIISFGEPIYYLNNIPYLVSTTKIFLNIDPKIYHVQYNVLGRDDTWNNYSSAFTLQEYPDGTYTLQARMLDGNGSEIKRFVSKQIRFDKTPPVTSLVDGMRKTLTTQADWEKGVEKINVDLTSSSGDVKLSRKLDKALSFDGIDDYISIPHSNVFNFAESNFTVSLWVKFASISGTRLYLGRNGISDRSWSFYYTDGNLRFAWQGSAYHDEAFAWTPSLNTWYLLTVVREASDLKVFVNDTQVGSTYNIGNDVIRSASSDFYIAENVGDRGYYFHGTMDEIGIYNRALSDAEIKDIYNKNEVSSGLVGLWRFDEETGNIAKDSVGGNDGTIYGATWVDVARLNYYTSGSYTNIITHEDIPVSSGIFNVIEEKPAGTDITYEISYSDDNFIYTPYLLINNKDEIEPHKYYKIRATLTTTDTEITPVLKEISLSYIERFSEAGILYVNKPVSFKLKAEDNLSGVKVTKYRINQGNWRDYYGEFITVDGINYMLEIYSIDRAENKENIKTVFYKTGTNLPITSVSIGFPKYIKPGVEPVYISSATKIRLFVVSAFIRVGRTEYKLNDEDWLIYKEPFSVEWEGLHTISYRSIDRAGNTEETKTIKVIVDNTGPVTTINNSIIKKITTGEDWESGVRENVDISSSPGDVKLGLEAGKALEFDGVNDYVDLGTSDNLKFQTFSISMWVKPASYLTNYPPLVSWGKNGWGVGIEASTNKIHVSKPWVGGVLSAGTISLNNWHHLIFICEDMGTTKKIKMYINGEFAGGSDSFNQTFTFTDSWNKLRIGVETDGTTWNYFAGDIDELGIYNRVLSDAEIRNLYNKRQVISNLVSYWKFNEGSGTIANDTVGTNHGTIYGSIWTEGVINNYYAGGTQTNIIVSEPVQAVSGIFTAVAEKPAGTDIIYKVAYSDDGVIYTEFIPIVNGSLVEPHKYTKVEATLKTTDLIITPVLKEIRLKYPTPADIINGISYLSEPNNIDFIAEDNAVGVKEIKYSIDGGNLQNYSGEPFNVTPDILHKINFYSIDNLNNVEAEKTAFVGRDSVPPVTEISISEPKYDYKDGTPLVVSSGTEFTLVATDPGERASGVAKTEYRICQGLSPNMDCPNVWQVYTVPFRLTNYIDGIYTVQYRSIDNVGNIEETKKKVIVMDSTVPLVKIHSPLQEATGIEKYVSGVVTIVGTATDLHFDYYKLEYCISNPEPVEGWNLIAESSNQIIEGVIGTWDTSNLTNGTYTIKLTAYDKVLNTSISTVQVFIGAPKHLLSIYDKLSHPDKLTVDEDGYIYVADRENDCYKVLDHSGNYLLFGKEVLNKPEGIALDSIGNVYVGNRNGNRVEKFDSSGNHIADYGGNGYLNKAVGLRVDEAGNIVVADRNNNSIRIISPDGSFNTIGVSMLDKPEDVEIAKDETGNIIYYVANRNEDNIKMFSKNGELVKTINALLKPDGLTLTKNKNIIVADSNNSRVVRIDRYGYIQLVLDGANSGKNFNHPKGVCLDISGNLYIADSMNKRIVIFGDELPELNNLPTVEEITNAKKELDKKPEWLKQALKRQDKEEKRKAQWNNGNAKNGKGKSNGQNNSKKPIWKEINNKDKKEVKQNNKANNKKPKIIYQHTTITDEKTGEILWQSNTGKPTGVINLNEIKQNKGKDKKEDKGERGKSEEHRKDKQDKDKGGQGNQGQGNQGQGNQGNQGNQGQGQGNQGQGNQGQGQGQGNQGNQGNQGQGNQGNQGNQGQGQGNQGQGNQGQGQGQGNQGNQGNQGQGQGQGKNK